MVMPSNGWTMREHQNQSTRTITDSIGLLLSITVRPILPGEGTGSGIIAVRASAAVVTARGP